VRCRVGGVADDDVEVVFVDADTGARVGTARVPRDRVPKYFEVPATVEIGSTKWLVDQVAPSVAADRAASSKLIVTVLRAPVVPPSAILYSLPTICDSLPAAATAVETECLRMHEDDWRQIEMVSEALHDVVGAELRAIREIYEHHARRDTHRKLVGFERIHVRAQPGRPLPGPVSLRRLLGLFPAPDHRYGGVGFTTSSGAVAGSFAGIYGPIQLYGVADGDQLLVLGLRRIARGASYTPQAEPMPQAEPIIALGRAMETFGTVIIDWCQCSIINASSLADYLASLTTSLPQRRAPDPMPGSSTVCFWLWLR
jgi:hypothetical protein